jgi:uncharacterized membrane protein
MARRFTGFLWVLFFVVVGATFYFGFLWGYNQGKEEAAVVASKKAAGEPTVEKGKADLRIRAGENYFSYELRAGELLATVVRINNEGAVGVKDLAIELEAPEPLWSIRTMPVTIAELAPGVGEEVAVEIKPPAGTEPGQYTLLVKVSGKAEGGASVEAERSLTVNIVE